RFDQPGTGKAVVSLEAVEPVPIVGDRIDMAAVRTVEIAAKLEVVGRIGENKIDGSGRQRTHRLHTVTRQNTAQRQFRRGFGARLRRADFGDDTHLLTLIPCSYPQGE